MKVVFKDHNSNFAEIKLKYLQKEKENSEKIIFFFSDCIEITPMFRVFDK